MRTAGAAYAQPLGVLRKSRAPRRARRADVRTVIPVTMAVKRGHVTPRLPLVVQTVTSWLDRRWRAILKGWAYCALPARALAAGQWRAATRHCPEMAGG